MNNFFQFWETVKHRWGHKRITSAAIELFCRDERIYVFQIQVRSNNFIHNPIHIRNRADLKFKSFYNQNPITVIRQFAIQRKHPKSRSSLEIDSSCSRFGSQHQM